ncbi:ABC transporter G family member 20, partial [Operophtera brumata]
TPYNSTEEAKSAVATGKVYGALHFSTNFSSAMAKRVAEGEVPDDIVEESSISVWLDMTNHQISYYLKSQLHKAYESFTKRAMVACDRNENLVQYL